MLVALLTAGLVAPMACVCVGPPLLASAPRPALCPGLSPAAVRLQVLVSAMLYPSDVSTTGAPKLPEQAPATIEFLSSSGSSLISAGPVPAVLLAIVTFVILSVAVLNMLL